MIVSVTFMGATIAGESIRDGDIFRCNGPDNPIYYNQEHMDATDLGILVEVLL